MIRPVEQWFLCGGVEHPDAPADALRLATFGVEQNIKVDIGGICEKLTGRLSAQFRDLIVIASYVFAADGAVVRGDKRRPDLNANWHRHFRFVVAVECPDIWSTPEMRGWLEQTLGFLSDDTYTFEFVPAKRTAPEQLTFSTNDGSPFLDWDHVDEVALFSGGLDSLGGAAQLILKERKNVILVSHRSASKTWKIQRELVGDLKSLSQVWGPDHVAIEVVRQDDRLRDERTQRSRSFLYAAIAGAIAHLLGRDRALLFENGIIGMNLPISRQVVGSIATRTTHPKVLWGLSKILGAVAGRRLAVENPFLLKTRADVLALIADAGAERLIRHSVSCAHVSDRHNASPHCGTCSQCVDRRFSMLAAGLEAHDPEEGYRVDLVTGEFKSDDARMLLLDYIDAADRFAEIRNVDDFLAKFGEANRVLPALMDALGMDAETAGRALFDLHRRQGQTVGKVLDQIFAQNARAIRKSELPATSLPMLLCSRGLRGIDSEGALVAREAPSSPVYDGGDNLLREDGEMFTLRYRGGRAFSMKPHKGLGHLRVLLQRPGEEVTAFALVDISEGREAASHPLATSLGVDEEALESVKETLAKLKEERDEAEEYCDHEAVAKKDAEMKELAAYLSREAGLGGKVRGEAPEQKKARDAVSNAINRAIAMIRRQNQAMAAHLDEHVQRGFFLKYRQDSIAWDTGSNGTPVVSHTGLSTVAAPASVEQ